MKKSTISALLFALLLIFCSCSAGKDVNPAGAEKEIDFALAAGGDTAFDPTQIIDFAIDGDNVYLLQGDWSILKYSADASFIEKYDYNLGEYGLTASRIAFGGGKTYLLDGHNNAIITVGSDRAISVSRLDFSDVGLAKSFYPTKSGTLMMSFADIDGAYTVEVDHRGEEAAIIGEKIAGYLIGENITYLPTVEEDENGKSVVEVTVYESGAATEKFRIGSDESARSMFGLSVYGKSGDDLFGLLHEFVNTTGNPEDEKYMQTSVSINIKSGKIKTSESRFSGVEIIELSERGAYCMKISDGILKVKPVGKYFSDWSDSTVYTLKK